MLRPSILPKLINHRCLSYASRGSFKDGVRYGKYGPVGSDKKVEFEKVHTAKQFLNYKRDRLKVTFIYFSVVPVILGAVMLLNWYKSTKAFKADTILK